MAASTQTTALPSTSASSHPSRQDGACPCGHGLEKDADFCRKCGTRRQATASLLSACSQEDKCPCGHELEQDADFCRKCGNQKGSLKEISTEQRSFSKTSTAATTTATLQNSTVLQISAQSVDDGAERVIRPVTDSGSTRDLQTTLLQSTIPSVPTTANRTRRRAACVEVLKKALGERFTRCIEPNTPEA